MKKIFFSALFVLLGVCSISAQQDNSPLFKGGNTPDSIVQITTILPGTTNPQTLTVEVTDGWAKIEGDIVLGRIEELQSAAQDRGVVIDGNQYRWPLGAIPYQIAGPFTADYEALIRASVDYINSSTHILLYQSNTASDRLFLIPANECSSFVGRQGGVQLVNLKDPFAAGNNGNGCYFSAIIHEIAHAAGLWHEQSREDRDAFVTINWANIQAGQSHNFDKHVSDGIDIGPYDFASRMHYGPFAFSANGQPTITAPGGQTFGNANEYSDGDVATINWLYPVRFCFPVHDLSATIPAVSRPLVFEAMSLIYSTATVNNGNKITYDAGSSVTLNPGFQATPGSVFHAVIEGCGGFYQMVVSPEMEEWILEAENQGNTPEATQPAINKSTNAGQATAVYVSPNPFTVNTTVTYTLPAAQEVDIQIFNALGNVVAQPVRQQYQDPGSYEYIFEAGDLPPGIYFLVMQTGGQKQTKRLVLTH